MKSTADVVAVTSSAAIERIPELVKPSALARRLGVSLSSLYSWHAEGRLPAYRLGDGRGALRFDLADVESFLASRREAR